MRDLLKYDGRFRIAFIFLAAVVVMIFLSFVSPYDPNKTFVVAMDTPPSLEHIFGTNSRGQDIFWWMTFAVRNSLFMGVMTAVISRVIAIFVGLTAGYQGGWLDRVLMSINDSFVVLPLLPILILLGFLLRDQMNLFLLGVILGFFGWPYDARLIRSQVLSLKERSFTRTAVYSGTNAILDHDQRAPSLRAADRVCHHHQQHAVVHWHGSHFERSWAFGFDHPYHWNRALLGQSARGVGGGDLVVDRRADSGGYHSVPRSVPALRKH